jgi:hypothetical protein
MLRSQPLTALVLCLGPGGATWVSVWVSRRFRVAEATRHIAIDKYRLL